MDFFKKKLEITGTSEAGIYPENKAGVN